MCATYLRAVPAAPRRFLDGPRWLWLCKYIGHQKRWWHFYIGEDGYLMGTSKALPTWKDRYTFLSGGQVCGRCGRVLGDFNADKV